MNKNKPLEGKHAVVTGGGRGIGSSIATALAKDGASITLMGRGQKRLEEKCAELQDNFSQKFLSVTADVTDFDAVQRGFEISRAALGDPVILVNNAGSVTSAPFSQTSPEIWKKMLDVNLNGSYYCISQVLPGMIKEGFGRIVNIASTAGVTGYPYVSAYCAAKHGMVGLTRSLALEVAGTGVTINAVCPGYTDTDLISGSVDKISEKTGRSRDDIRSEFVSNVPQGRFVKPAEIASAVKWLCAEEQASLIGETIVISGGEVLR